jgi:hypothetical protein
VSRVGATGDQIVRLAHWVSFSFDPEQHVEQ